MDHTRLQILQPLFDSLEDLRQSYVRFSRGIPSVSEAAKNCDTALKKALSHLGDPDVSEILDTLIADAQEQVKTPDQLRQNYEENTIELLSQERRLLEHAGFKPEESRRFLEEFFQADWAKASHISNVEDLKEALIKAHRAYISAINDARDREKNREIAQQFRNRSPRKVKKQKKTSGQKSMFSALFGVSVISVDAIGGVFPLSFALGGAAIWQSGRDFIDYIDDEEA
jgi:hypothetical protein